MLSHLWRRLVTDPIAYRRRTRLDLRYCPHCWDYTDCWRKEGNR